MFAAADVRYHTPWNEFKRLDYSATKMMYQMISFPRRVVGNVVNRHSQSCSSWVVGIGLSAPIGVIYLGCKAVSQMRGRRGAFRPPWCFFRFHRESLSKYSILNDFDKNQVRIRRNGPRLGNSMRVFW